MGFQPLLKLSTSFQNHIILRDDYMPSIIPDLGGGGGGKIASLSWIIRGGFIMKVKSDQELKVEN